jgi:ketosteroid isomerase-like protein
MQDSKRRDGLPDNSYGVLDMFLNLLFGYCRLMEKTLTATDIVDRYFRALGARDFPAARAFLADDLRFEGPIDRFDRADDFMKEISGLYGMVKGVDHQAKIADGDEVAVFYVLDTPLAKAPVAEWHTVQAGKIARIRAYFDARPFAAPPPSPSQS